MTSNDPPKTVVVVGLSGAGLKTFNHLLNHLYPSSWFCNSHNRNIRLIAIEKSTFAYWPLGALRACVLEGYENEIIRDFDHIIPSRLKQDQRVKIITGTEVVEVDFENRVLKVDRSLEEFGLESGTTLKFDFLVIGSGSSYAFPCRPSEDAKSPSMMKSHLKILQQDIKNSKSILVVGAGAVGLEFAGEVSWKYPKRDKKIVIVGSSPGLLSDYDKSLGQSIEKQLLDRGVQIIYNHRAKLSDVGIVKTGKIEPNTKVALKPVDGSDVVEVEVDFVFLATGNKPNTHFIPPEYLNTSSKRITVNSYFQVCKPGSPSLQPLSGIYALGDASDFKESQLYAALEGQAHTVSKNLIAEIESPGTAPKVTHKPFEGTIVIPLGPYGGGSQIYGYTFGLGAVATSLIKGRTLFISLFREMYPTKDP